MGDSQFWKPPCAKDDFQIFQRSGVAFKIGGGNDMRIQTSDPRNFLTAALRIDFVNGLGVTKESSFFQSLVAAVYIR